MKKCIVIHILFLVFSIFGQNISHVDASDNLLAVVIMVKNEVDVIIPTLKPFVDAGIQSFLVFDTGSNDGTQQKINAYFKESGILNAHIIEEPFVDFSTSRNRALDLAEQIFANYTFLIMHNHEQNELSIFLVHTVVVHIQSKKHLVLFHLPYQGLIHEQVRCNEHYIHDV